MIVSALLTCHNRRDSTLRCLQTLVKSGEKAGVTLKIFLTDDGSTDGTTEAVAAFEQVRLVRGDGSLYWTGGMLAAYRRAVDEAFDFLLWLNDDVVLSEDALNRLLSTSATLGDDAVIVGALRDPKTNQTSYGGYVRDQKDPFRLLRCDPGELPVRVDTMNGNIVWIPRGVDRIIGTVDERFPHNMADLDFGFRCGSNSVSIVLSPGHLGECERNQAKDGWRDPSLPLATRWRAVASVKGFPPRAWLLFTYRYAGWRWPLRFVSPYCQAILPETTALLRRLVKRGSSWRRELSERADAGHGGTGIPGGRQ